MTPEQQKLSDQLTKLQRQIVINLVSGKMSQREAYIAAGGKGKTENTQDASVSEILSNPKVKGFYDSLVAEAVSDAVMTRQEALETLSNIARTTVKDVVRFSKHEAGEEDGEPVYQTSWELLDGDEVGEAHVGAISELTAGRDGFKFKLHSQVQAIKQIGEMEGWEAPKKVAPCTPDGKALVLNFIPVGKKQG